MDVGKNSLRFANVLLIHNENSRVFCKRIEDGIVLNQQVGIEGGW